MNKCETCMTRLGQQQRQLAGCGYLPRYADEKFVSPWSPNGMWFKWLGDAPKHCAGYTTNLPEVIEIARARLHWSKGSLEAFCGEEQPTEVLMMGIEVLEGAIGEVVTWCSVPKKDGGGGA